MRFSRSAGILKGGPWSFLGVQLLSIVSITTWTVVITYLELVIVNKLLPIRVSLNDELVGADQSEHGIFHGGNYNREDEEGQNNNGQNSNQQLDLEMHTNENTEATSTEGEQQDLGTYMRKFKLQFHYSERKSVVLAADGSKKQIRNGIVHSENNQAFDHQDKD